MSHSCPEPLEPLPACPAEPASDRGPIAQARAWAELVLDAEEPILWMIGDNAPLVEILNAVCLMIEGLCEGTRCSILLLVGEGRSLRLSAAPTIPAEYLGAMKLVDFESCESVVHRGEPVIVEDIAADPRWSTAASAILACGLKACWSVPIRSGGGAILGAFGTYCLEARGPSEWEMRAIARSARLAAIAFTRSRAEEAIRAGDDRYRRIIETAHEGIWMIDEGQKITYVNGRMAEMLGFRPEELIGRSAWELSFAEDHPIGRRSWERKEKLGERENVEFRLMRKDRSVFWGHFATSPVTLEGGKFAGALAMVTDITERIEAENALRESEERFRQMTDSMPQIAWTTRPDGSFEYFNRRWFDYTGRTPEESFASEGWRLVVHPDDAERSSAEARRSRAADAVFESELRLRNRDGRYRWHLARSAPVLNEEGRVVRRFGTATDIDDLKRVEAEVLLSKRRLELAQEVGGIGAFDWDIATNRVEWSVSQEALFGLEAGGFGGCYEHFAAMIHHEDRDRVEVEAQRPIVDGSDFRAEFRIIRPDGSTRWLVGLARVIHDESGRPARMIGVNLDVTDRKRLEGELTRRMDELAEADVRKDEFLATLAHELRNPLAPIRSVLQLLADAEAGPSSLEAERMMAERQVAHLARLVDDLMDVARISRGRIELRKQPVELSTIVSEAVEAARPSLDRRGHELTVDLHGTSVELEADPTRLEQVLSNLLANAIKYTDPGGRIALSAEVRGDEVVIAVRDTGIGIDPAMLPRVFEMFVQAERRSDHSRGGLGIGLGLVKSLVELHGGRIEARSPGRGAGSEFEVHLPISSKPLGVKGPAASAPPSVPGGPLRRRILVVDDNEDAALSLAKLLKRVYRQEVRVAHDGPSALDQAESLRPDLVLLDIGMPGMDGYEVARRLRAGVGFEATILVALTGWGQDNDRARSKEAGFDRHLVKPVGPEELESVLAMGR